jgi:hypothetical protein
MTGNSPGLARRSLLSGAAATALGAILLKTTPAARAVLWSGAPRPGGPAAGEGGSMAAAGEGVLPLRGGLRPARNPGGVRQPAGASLGGIRVGVTLNMRAFPRGTTPAAAFSHWEQVTGCTPLATKIYFNRRQFPMKPYGKLAAAIARGMTAVLCYQPAFGPPSRADARAITASLTALRRAGLRNACVVLWTEPQDHNKLHVPQQAFLDGFRFYAPAVRASGWPLFYCANSNQDTWAAYYPGDAYCDGVAVDDYASHQNWTDIWGPGGIARIADAGHKPFGWFEMGRAGLNNPPPLSVVNAYLSDATAYFASRRRAGRPSGPVIWYNGVGSNVLAPLTYSSNSKIARAYFPAMYHALT